MNRILTITIAFTLYSFPAFTQETSGGFGQGSVLIGYDSRTCGAGLEGSIRYDSATDSWTQCDGVSWSALGSGLSADSVLESHLKAVDAPADEECLTYETTTGDFEWQSCGSGGGGLWSDSGSGYIEYNSSLGGILVGGMTGIPAPVMP